MWTYYRNSQVNAWFSCKVSGTRKKFFTAITKYLWTACSFYRFGMTVLICCIYWQCRLLKLCSVDDCWIGALVKWYWQGITEILGETVVHQRPHVDLSEIESGLRGGDGDMIQCVRSATLCCREGNEDKIGKEHWYEHVPKSVETNNETVLWNSKWKLTEPSQMRNRAS